MEKHILWSSELSKNKRSVAWAPVDDDQDGGEGAGGESSPDVDIAIQQTLHLSHACYMGDAKDPQVVSVKYKTSKAAPRGVSVENEEGEGADWNKGVLCVLRNSSASSGPSLVNLAFNIKTDAPITFELTSGTGPVSIFGLLPIFLIMETRRTSTTGIILSSNFVADACWEREFCEFVKNQNFGGEDAFSRNISI